jgi:hypothetical protein
MLVPGSAPTQDPSLERRISEAIRVTEGVFPFPGYKPPLGHSYGRAAWHAMRAGISPHLPEFSTLDANRDAKPLCSANWGINAGP